MNTENFLRNYYGMYMEQIRDLFQSSSETQAYEILIHNVETEIRNAFATFIQNGRDGSRLNPDTLTGRQAYDAMDLLDRMSMLNCMGEFIDNGTCNVHIDLQGYPELEYTSIYAVLERLVQIMGDLPAGTKNVQLAITVKTRQSARLETLQEYVHLVFPDIRIAVRYRPLIRDDSRDMKVEEIDLYYREFSRDNTLPDTFYITQRDLAKGYCHLSAVQNPDREKAVQKAITAMYSALLSLPVADAENYLNQNPAIREHIRKELMEKQWARAVNGTREVILQWIPSASAVEASAEA